MITDPLAGRLASDALPFAMENDMQPCPGDRGKPLTHTAGTTAIGVPSTIQLGRTTVPAKKLSRPWLLLLPFALGTGLSYLLCNIAGLLAGPLAEELELGPTDLGLLASVLFLAMAAAQIPLGILLDRLGPRRLMSACLLVTAAGCLLCSGGTSLSIFIIARAMIGFGIAVAYLSGLKAARLWLPAHRLGTINGVLMAAGALGAVAATLPAQAIIDAIGWLLLFVALAAVSFTCALLVMILVPDTPRHKQSLGELKLTTWHAICRDGIFWRLAPLSAALIGSAWALQGFWAALWLAEVEGLDPASVAHRLFRMALVLGAGSLVLGWLSDRSHPYWALMLAVLSGLSILAHLSLAAGSPLPPNIAWYLIALTGAASVWSFSVLLGEFPEHMSGRISTALNLILLLAAFAFQNLFGIVADGASIPSERGSAFATAFVVSAVVQIMALAWFLLPETSMARFAQHLAPRPPQLLAAHKPSEPTSPYRRAHVAWLQRVHDARQQLEFWRYAAICSGAVCIALISIVSPNPIANF